MNQDKSKGKISKVKPSPDYPNERGSYLRGNDFSPVAVVVLLNAPRPLVNQPDTKDIEIPPDIENLVRISVETGAALAGTLQTENIGIEIIICNVVGNPISATWSSVEKRSRATKRGMRLKRF